MRGEKREKVKKREKFHLRMREKNVKFDISQREKVKKREKFHLRMREKKRAKV